MLTLKIHAPFLTCKLSRPDCNSSLPFSSFYKKGLHAFAPWVLSIVMPGYSSAYLSAHAILQNGCDILGRPHSILFNAIILSSLEDYPRVLCSLHYITPYAAWFIHGGTYDIFAKVRIIPPGMRCNVLMPFLFEVVPFCASVHLPPDNGPYEEFTFMGDILQVRFFIFPCVILNMSSQLLPLPFNPMTNLASCTIPARFFVCGRVSAVNADLTTFYISLSQTLTHTTLRCDLTLHCTMVHAFIGAQRFVLVPPTLDMVSLSGMFISFHAKAADIEVDDLTYLACPHGDIHTQNATAHFHQHMESID